MIFRFISYLLLKTEATFIFIPTDLPVHASFFQQFQKKIQKSIQLHQLNKALFEVPIKAQPTIYHNVTQFFTN